MIKKALLYSFLIITSILTLIPFYLDALAKSLCLMEKQVFLPTILTVLMLTSRTIKSFETGSVGEAF